MDSEIAEKVRTELSRLKERRLSETTCRILTAAGANASFMLVGGTWQVFDADGLLTLRLFRLAPSEGYPAELPQGIAIDVPLVTSEDARLTARGVARLRQPDGAPVRLTVLGTAEPFLNDCLHVTPIVVFDRAGAAH